MKDLAFNIKCTLPLAVSQVLTAETWKGGPLVQLDSEVARCTASDVKVNRAWLAPFVKAFPDRVPSQFLIADTFLYLDRLFMGSLLLQYKEDEVQTKNTLAADEAQKVKRLIGGLRNLWRSSPLLAFRVRNDIRHNFFHFHKPFKSFVFWHHLIFRSDRERPGHL